MTLGASLVEHVMARSLEPYLVYNWHRTWYIIGSTCHGAFLGTILGASLGRTRHGAFLGTTFGASLGITIGASLGEHIMACSLAPQLVHH
jgi:ABC-type nitrate/sulfonate/bicarbonate transport system permease component